MFGIRPVKTLLLLGLLFILFLATRVEPVEKKAQTSNTQTQLHSLIKHPLEKQKKPTPHDAVNVLHHLFHKKIEDPAMLCSYKKAKTRYFIACKQGEIIKDNYWEFSLKKDQLHLLARSKSSLYIIKKYKFKELRSDTHKAYPEVERALVAFFKKG